jgi:hypothetical protein
MESGTYFLCVLSQGCVFLDGVLDCLGVGNFHQGEADDRHGGWLWGVGGLIGLS